jgi:hypothetical protein
MIRLVLALSILISAQTRAQWTRVTEIPPFDVPSLFVRADTIYAATDSAVFISRNQGVNWTRSSTIPNAPIFIDAVTVFGGKLFAGTGGNGVLVSPDTGKTWQSLNNGLSGLGSNYIGAFVERNGMLYASTIGAGVFVLHDNEWSPFGNLAGELAGNVEFLGLKGDTLVAGAGGNGYVWFAPPDASLWTGVLVAPLQIEPLTVYSVVRFDGLLYAGTTYGIYRSTNDGLNWTYSGSGFPIGRLVRLLVVGQTLYATASAADTRWYKSTSGNEWTFIENVPYTFAEAVVNGTFYAARIDGLWRRDITTSLPHHEAFPSRLELSQNYPNPFNPTTVINFQLPVSGWTRLTVYNIMGQEAATLVNESLQAGSHSLTWNAEHFPSGVYFYRLTADNFVETKKLMLIR